MTFVRVAPLLMLAACASDPIGTSLAGNGDRAPTDVEPGVQDVSSYGADAGAIEPKSGTPYTGGIRQWIALPEFRDPGYKGIALAGSMYIFPTLPDARASQLRTASPSFGGRLGTWTLIPRPCAGDFQATSGSLELDCGAVRYVLRGGGQANAQFEPVPAGLEPPARVARADAAPLFVEADGFRYEARGSALVYAKVNDTRPNRWIEASTLPATEQLVIAGDYIFAFGAQGVFRAERVRTH